MSQGLDRSVIRILSQNGATVGAGFVVSEHLAVTCAHVVLSATNKPNEQIRLARENVAGEKVNIEFYVGKHRQLAETLFIGWSPPDRDDIAFLQVESLPDDIIPVTLGTAENRTGHPYTSLGFPLLLDREARYAHDYIGGIVPITSRRPMLQIEGNKIEEGMSGSPILDRQTNRVIGIVSEFIDAGERFAYATTSDTLAWLYPALHLWPDTHGPTDWYKYLNFLIDTNQGLKLPDGREVPLEKVYVSLRADAMNAAERRAEHEFYVKDVQVLMQFVQGTTDQYRLFAAIRRAIARRPRMQMLIARNWDMLFGERERVTLNLAEVIQKHRFVVVLGDPGSGKTTLCKWLTVQFARALIEGAEKLVVPLDLVNPGAESEKLVDLGVPRLPIFIRIADYVNWDKNILPIEKFIGSHHNPKILPNELTGEIIAAITHRYLDMGKAMVILDGLDEVSDPDQRRAVMQAVSHFIETYGTRGNRVLLTSRIVGYQFQPLTHLPHYTVEDMDESAILAFCRAWMAHVEVEGDPVSQGDRLKDAIFQHSHPGVRAIAGNPLLLTILAQVYQDSADRSLPARRVDLFDQAMHVFYKRREHLWDKRSITELRLTRALGAVASYIHSNELTSFTDKGAIIASLRSVLSEPDQVSEVLEVADEGTGFLVSRGEGVYGFLHRALQEYFVAKYLVDNPNGVSERLAALALDPTWREPTVLAVGLISQPSYPTTDHSLLAKVFNSILEHFDPAGDVLPRRELLAAAACVECSRISPEVVERIVDKLLSFYVERQGKTKSQVLRQRIQRAFELLRDSAANDATLQSLCKALNDSSFDRRYTACNIIIETKWDSPEIARALVRAHRNYEGPAGSFLVALYNLSKRHPEHFTSDFLMFRRAVETEPSLWRKISESPEWSALIRSLYLPPDTELEPNYINRDSPLTEFLLNALRQPLKSEPLTSLRTSLRTFANESGTALAADAALALATLNDAVWLNHLLESETINLDVQSPILTRLTFTGTKNLTLMINMAHGENLVQNIIKDLQGYLDVDVVEGLLRATESDVGIGMIRVLIRNLTLDLDSVTDSVRASEIASQFERTFALASKITAMRKPAQNSNLFLAREFDRDAARAFTNETAQSLGRDLALSREITKELETTEATLIRVRERWLEDQNLLQHTGKALDSLQSFKLSFSDLLVLQLWGKSFEALATRFSRRGELILKDNAQFLTLDSLPSVIADLGSSDDIRRYRARRGLVSEKHASDLGKLFIERLAELHLANNANYQVGTQIAWALTWLIYDRADWVESWIEVLGTETDPDQSKIAEDILTNIYRPTEDVLQLIAASVPHTSARVNNALLTSLGWSAKFDKLPEKYRAATRDRLLVWLQSEQATDAKPALLRTLGYWPDEYLVVSRKLLMYQPQSEKEQSEWLMALARLGTAIARTRAEPSDDDLIAQAESAQQRNEIQGQVDHVLKKALPGVVAVAALVRWNVSNGVEQLLSNLQSLISDSSSILAGLMEAGSNDDPWDDTYHSVIAKAIRILIESSDELLASLVMQCKQALLQDQWPRRRIALAAIAACAEIMPSALQKSYGDSLELENALVRSALDADSYNARRFALTALSYLRTVTPEVVPALLVGCQDVEAVQRDAIEATKRFQLIEGNPLPALGTALNSGSASTAFAVAQMLGTLGRNASGQNLQDEITTMLVDALKNAENMQREVFISEDEWSEPNRRGNLEDAVYGALLQVARWIE